MAGLPPAQVGRVVGMGGAFDLPCVGDAIRWVRAWPRVWLGNVLP
jgi:hypothetical protein